MVLNMGERSSIYFLLFEIPYPVNQDVPSNTVTLYNLDDVKTWVESPSLGKHSCRITDVSKLSQTR